MLRKHEGTTESSILNVSEKERIEREREIVEHSPNIMYSRRYYDDEFEYRLQSLGGLLIHP